MSLQLIDLTQRPKMVSCFAKVLEFETFIVNVAEIEFVTIFQVTHGKLPRAAIPFAPYLAVLGRYHTIAARSKFIGVNKRLGRYEGKVPMLTIRFASAGAS